MRLLFASDGYPEFDRNSADFRLFQLMQAMLGHAEVHFSPLGSSGQRQLTGDNASNRYRDGLMEAGITVVAGAPGSVIRDSQFDAIVLEWYFTAAPYIRRIRATSPGTRVITDSVDVAFNRLRAKARVSSSAKDWRVAEVARKLELDTYRRSDLVLTVSDQDGKILASEEPNIRSFTIPNIHPLHEFPDLAIRADKTIIFVGSRSDANDDAMCFFCHEVLPLIIAREPDAVFRVVGTVTIPELDEQLNRSVERLGFVADTRPLLERSLVSVAPLRFGGGMKGKVGEAMSLGLPVVATTIGAEGFGLEPGRDALVADTAQAFSDAVVSLLRQPQLRARVALAGWQFISENYSDVAVRKRVASLAELIARIVPKRLSVLDRAAFGASEMWQRQVAWRLR